MELQLELLCTAVETLTLRDPTVSRDNRVKPESVARLTALLSTRWDKI
jgi:hypothetical protein